MEVALKLFDEQSCTKSQSFKLPYMVFPGACDQ